MKSWMDTRPYLMWYIAFVVTLEAVVYLVRVI